MHIEVGVWCVCVCVCVFLCLCVCVCLCVGVHVYVWRMYMWGACAMYVCTCNFVRACTISTAQYVYLVVYDIHALACFYV